MFFLQSIDSKLVELALGIPIHASTVSSYREAGIIPLGEFRKLTLAQYFVRVSSVEKFTNEELDLRSGLSESNYKKNSSLKTIAIFNSDLIEPYDINPRNVDNLYSYSRWERLSVQFDSDYSTIRKEDTPHL